MNQWAPWLDDPDDPADSYMTPEENTLAARRAAGLTMDYDPNQPRDPKGSSTGGQWTSKGSSGSSMSMNPDPEGNEDPNMFKQFMTDEMWKRMRNSIAVAKAMPETYKIESEQRTAMREAIADKLYKRDIDKRVQGREATIILGLPGAGKSTLANPLIKEGAIEIDPDIVKQEIPEFNGGIGANAVHEESSMINKQILARAIANGDNLVWPRIDGKDKLERDIKKLQENGYKVHVAIIDVSQETAIRSAVDRFEHTGRLVSPSTILEYGNTPEETYQTAKGIEGVTVARYKREHGKGVEQVVDDAGFDPSQPRDKDGQWTAGWFKGTTVIRRKGKKYPRTSEVFAEHPDDAEKWLIKNRLALGSLKEGESISVEGPIVKVREDTRAHVPKAPNKGSKEYEALQAMQKRYDEGGYKGD